jgi:hypothetical protein
MNQKHVPGEGPHDSFAETKGYDQGTHEKSRNGDDVNQHFLFRHFSSVVDGMYNAYVPFNVHGGENGDGKTSRCEEYRKESKKYMAICTAC